MQALLLSPPPSSSFIPKTRVKSLCFNSLTASAIENRRPQKLQFSVNCRNIEMTAASPSSIETAPKWAQKTVTIPAQRRGCHLITSRILKEIGQDLSGFKCGLAHFFLQHTSASLTINENYDSDVRDDTETFLKKIVPEGRSAPWKHTLKFGGVYWPVSLKRPGCYLLYGDASNPEHCDPNGPDDMPAHIKSSMFGCSLTIPITDGTLNMGTWQGLCEHRDAATPRRVVVTLNGI